MLRPLGPLALALLATTLDVLIGVPGNGLLALVIASIYQLAHRGFGRVLALYLLGAVVIFGAWFTSGAHGRERATVVIAACRRYQADHGHLPARLEDLVPRYLPAVPRASYHAFGEFRYRSRPGFTSLTWFVLPPFGRGYYVFEEDRWGWLD
jgi:hypothetical protein